MWVVVMVVAMVVVTGTQRGEEKGLGILFSSCKRDADENALICKRSPRVVA